MPGQPPGPSGTSTPAGKSTCGEDTLGVQGLKGNGGNLLLHKLTHRQLFLPRASQVWENAQLLGVIP